MSLRFRNWSNNDEDNDDLFEDDHQMPLLSPTRHHGGINNSEEEMGMSSDEDLMPRIEGAGEDKKRRCCGWLSALDGSVLWIYASVFLTVAGSVCSQPVMVLYFNFREWTSQDDIFFYSLINFLNPLTTVLLNPVFGLWQDHRPTKEVFLCDIILTSYGYLCMALSGNRWVFMVGYILSRVTTAQGGVRAGYIIKTTTTDDRTLALSFLPLGALAGALVGPLITLACSQMPPIIAHGILFDQSTLVFWVACFLSTIRLPMLMFGFNEKRSDASSSSSSSSDPLSGRSVASSTPRSLHNPSDGRQNPWAWLCYFSVVLFLFQLSSGVYTPLFNLILVNYWGFTQVDLSFVLLGIILLSIPPPSLMAFASRRLGVQDRVFLAIGLMLGLLAMVIFAFPSSSIYSLIIGGVLATPLTGSVLPACSSLYSKKVGPDVASGLKISLLTSMSSLGYAVGTLLSNISVETYNTLLLLVWLAPIGVSLLLALAAWSRMGIFFVSEIIVDLNDWVMIDVDYAAPSPLVQQKTPRLSGETAPLSLHPRESIRSLGISIFDDPP
ncbi:MAG: MFS transporter [archaeon]|nr:MFS transporter [archaeon]